MNGSLNQKEIKPMEDVAMLEMGPKKIDEIIRHIDDAIEKIRSGNEPDKEELVKDLEIAKEKALSLRESLNKPNPETIN